MGVQALRGCLQGGGRELNILIRAEASTKELLLMNKCSEYSRGKRNYLPPPQRPSSSKMALAGQRTDMVDMVLLAFPALLYLP